MNKVILIGRLTRNPEVTYAQDANQTCIARYSLAVDRRFKREGQQEADFINCVTFGKGAEFAQKYLAKGTKIAVVGRLQTGSYTNREGRKIYTTDVVVEEQEFAESKASQNTTQNAPERRQEAYTSVPDPMPTSANPTVENGFMSIPDGIEDELPFV